MRTANTVSLAKQFAMHPLLRAVPESLRRHLVNDAVERTYPKGQRLYYSGDPPSYVFIIRSGLVALTGQDERGNVYATMTYSPGDVLGAAAAVLQIPHVMTPIAMVETVAVLLNGTTFNNLYRQLPALGQEVVAELYRILRRAETATISFARRPVPGRVAALLLNSVGGGAAPTSGSPVVDLMFSHQELAILLGTTRETITRVLAGLSRTGVIAIDGRRVRLLQMDWLRRLADNECPNSGIPGPVATDGSADR
jgi:CRP/FNR family transcriptional regulator